jgi:ATP-dependent Clp protease ATP-binding subunit ClpA
MWQERCQQMCREVSKTNAILHLNNLGELLEVGKASRGQQSVGSFLRPWIARGEVLAIAECTPEQASAIERNEPHLLGAFQQFILAERTPEQTRTILSRVLATAPGRESKDAAGNEAALVRLHQLHRRYATYSANPGRPLRFLKNLLADRFPEKQLDEVQVIEAFSRETGLPRVLLDDDTPLDPAATGDWFARRVIGQPDAAEHVVNLLVMIKARLARPRKPLGSFLFIGPTGTGKTEMAKALAGFLFGDPTRLVRFDLNEFSNPHSVQRLIGGATAGSEGLLTARIREQPFSVVLLDEFEKADPAFFDLLLQILGDGRLTDAEGRVADFCNNVIVMTSNLGAEAFQRGRAGFQPAGEQAAEAQSHFADAVRKFLRPEIYNRIDAIVPFGGLGREIVRAIAQRHLELLRQRDGIRLRPIEWQMQEDVADYLATAGYSHRYGARPLKRALEQQLLVPLAEELNRYQEATPLKVHIGLAEGRIRIQAGAQAPDEGTQQSPARDPLAQQIVIQRRRIGRLQQCVTTARLEDEVTMLESLERRLKSTGLKPQQLQARLAKLPKLRDCLAAVSKLSDRARRLETETLGDCISVRLSKTPFFNRSLRHWKQNFTG